MENPFLHYKSAITEAFEHYKSMIENDVSKYQLAENGFNWVLDSVLSDLEVNKPLSDEEFSKLSTYVLELCDAFLKLKTV